MKKNHPFLPVWNLESKILILGTLPSVVSSKLGFYYMHPQNRFWKVLSLVYQEDVYSMTIEEKKDFILRKHLALYDVVASCSIDQSKDASIEDVTITDLHTLVQKMPIQKILFNGKKAYALGIEAYPKWKNIAACLPSTSSANAKVSLEELYRVWKDALLG